MATGKTVLAGLINPEVMADMISASVGSKIKFAPLAAIDNTLVGQPGNTLTVPKFAYIGDAEDVAEGVAMDTVVLTATSDDVTVKKAGKAVELTDEAVLSGYGDPVGEANNQLAQAIAQKIDRDCVTALGTASLKMVAGATELAPTVAVNAINYDDVVNAVDMFAEEDDEPKVLIIHPLQKGALRKDADFIDRNKFGGSVMMDGVIGEIAGCQVIASNKVPSDTAYVNFIVKAGALGILMKKDVEVETDRDILAKTTVISVDEHYTAYLADESKAVKITFKK